MFNKADVKSRAIELYQTGIEAANPATLVRRCFNRLQPTRSSTHILSVGKAACSMMDAALENVAASSAIVITSYENLRPVKGAQVYGAGHPQPDENGLKAAFRVKALAERLTQDDLLILLLSGGASAMLPCPIPNLPFEDKQTLNTLMLQSGMTIEQINLVRQNLSQLKGGRLRQLAEPAAVESLILSDVIGDDMKVIGGGLTASPLGNPSNAISTLTDAGLWPHLPSSVRRALTTLAPAKISNFPTNNVLIGSNIQSLHTMAAASGGKIMNVKLTGSVADAADEISTNILSDSSSILIWGGETTVQVTGKGKGGRNQELALRVLQKLHNLDGAWAFLSAGSDGIDGPTDAAGGLVDHTKRFGTNTQALLEDNDSYHALEQMDALFRTGATGTNVADFQIFIRDRTLAKT